MGSEPRPSKEFEIDGATKLRELTTDDAPRLFSVIDTNRAYLREWLPWLDSQQGPTDSLEFIRRSKEENQQGIALTLAIEHLGKIVGVIGFHEYDYEKGQASMGYWISAPHQGKGIVTKSCKRLIAYAFRDLRFNKVIMRIATENHASRRVAERCGLSQEETISQAEWLYDHHVDQTVYSVLAEDWSDH